MTPFEQDFEKQCSAGRAKSSVFNVKDALAILARLLGRWLEGYGRQQMDDRQSYDSLGERVQALEKWKQDTENKERA